MLMSMPLSYAETGCIRATIESVTDARHHTCNEENTDIALELDESRWKARQTQDGDTDTRCSSI